MISIFPLKACDNLVTRKIKLEFMCTYLVKQNFERRIKVRYIKLNIHIEMWLKTLLCNVVKFIVYHYNIYCPSPSLILRIYEL